MRQPPPPSEGVPSLLAVLADLGVDHGVVPDPTFRRDLEWVPFVELLDQLPARIDSLGLALGGARPAVAASLLARSFVPLVATPTVVGASYVGRVVDLRSPGLLVGMGDGRVGAVAPGRPHLVEAGPDPQVGIVEELVVGLCGQLIDEVRRHVRTGERHLWGNVSLAVAAPFAVLLATGRHDGRSFRDAVLQHPLLHGLVEVLDASEDDRPVDVVRRRTCCLLTKAPPPHAMMCGTCSLHPRSEHLRQLGLYYRSLRASPA